MFCVGICCLSVARTLAPASNGVWIVSFSLAREKETLLDFFFRLLLLKQDKTLLAAERGEGGWEVVFSVGHISCLRCSWLLSQGLWCIAPKGNCEKERKQRGAHVGAEERFFRETKKSLPDGRPRPPLQQGRWWHWL